MFKKLVLMLLVILIASPAVQAGAASAPITVKWHGKTVKFTGVQPFAKDKTVLVPIRPVAGEFGANVKLEKKGNSQQLTITTFARTAILVIGSKQMKVNERTLNLDTAPQIKQSTVLVPIQALQEIGLKVNWSKAKRSIELNPEFTVVKKYVMPVLVASVRFRGQYEEISDVYEKLDHEVKDLVNARGFSLYYEQNYEKGHDTEICIPVSKSVEGASIEYKGKQLPVTFKILEGGYFLSVVHQGTPDTLANVWAQIEEYAKNTGVKILSPSREIYVQEDLKDYRKQVTEIQLQLKN
ncbi:stalk domain-containing protein [Paenibacillus tuaregi]|uniref:stalk domain-containing protein n=1 Tax=Paenibacillus tuaregi TaxID=1816681 RepID=UPI0008384C14|nr:stalk domain-containing protein [Paenibacillus tuaregi]